MTDAEKMRHHLAKRIAQALATARAAERERIVAWLRLDMQPKTLGRDPLDGDYRAIIDGVQLRALAHAIERGDHLPRSGGADNG